MTKISAKNSVSIKISAKALKFLHQLDVTNRLRIDRTIDKLKENPLLGKQLTGVKVLRRAKAGDYRVIYTYKKEELIILIIKIGHRKEIYRDLS